MTTFQLRKTLFASALAFGLLGALSNAMAQSEHEGHHPQNTQTGKPAAQKPQPGEMKSQGNMNMGSGQMPQGGMMDHSQMMDHGGMDHDQMMKQMHDQNMGQGQMNHDGMSPEKAASGAKDGKNGQ